jgi:hypothetical protein
MRIDSALLMLNALSRTERLTSPKGMVTEIAKAIPNKKANIKSILIKV